MADISKCTGIRFGKECHLREQCYRFTALANPYSQSYLTPSEKEKPCELYWPVREVSK